MIVLKQIKLKESCGMKNSKAYAINIMGWITIIVGVIGSFVIGDVYQVVSYSFTGIERSTYNWSLAIMCCISSVFIGLVIIGLAEIIELLQQNYDKNTLIEEKINGFESSLNEISNNTKQPSAENYNETLPPL